MSAVEKQLSYDELYSEYLKLKQKLPAHLPRKEIIIELEKLTI